MNVISLMVNALGQFSTFSSPARVVNDYLGDRT